jgi:myo-inositol-1(or 4)-monophosphatase
MENELVREYRTVAETAALAAGELLANGGSALRSVDLEEAHDVKLRADREAENLVRRLLGEKSPYPVIGEEMGGDASLTVGDQPYWVVDPLDGTHNYLRNVPICCVSIGLMRGLEPILGVIYDFNREEVFSADTFGGGFLLNGQKVEPKWAESLVQASLNTGFPVGRENSTENLNSFFLKIQAFKKVRSVGSAALGMAWVAAGRFDAYYEEGIRLWDVAAGLALVRAAGGHFRITPEASRPLAYFVWAAGKEEFIFDT